MHNSSPPGSKEAVYCRHPPIPASHTGLKCQAPDWQSSLKGHAKLTFPMGPQQPGVRSPPAPELDRREDTVPIGKDYSAGPGVAWRLCNTGPSHPGPAENLLQNRFELGPLGLIGVNPGQYRGRSRRGRGRQLCGCARAGLEQQSFRLLGPQAWTCGVPHRHSASMEAQSANHSSHPARFERL